ncbi:MAG: hypothetical protein LC794_15950 [Acidobacteria bacterium]|nr:hypothetical protein [Acidobacteriota bacterium]
MEQLSSNPLRVALEARSIGRNALLRRWFLLSLLVCTWLPMVFFILLARTADASGGSLAGIKTVFLFLGTAHVPATLFFYSDKEFAPIIQQHRGRYIYVPILLTIITGLVFAFLDFTTQAFVLLAYWSWQAFHYGRQNVGIYAFASISETSRPPRKEERLAIEAGTLLAILGTFKILGTAVAPAYLHSTFDYLYRFGLLGFAGLLIFSVVVYARGFKDTTLFKTLFFFTAVLFFLPVFVSTNNNIAFLSYAIAHGLQYIIFMMVVSSTAPTAAPTRAFPYKSFATFLVFVLIAGFAFWRVGDLREIAFVKNAWPYARAADFLFGAVLGATMSHFVIDADAWRLRLERQRAYMTKRFYFVFD